MDPRKSGNLRDMSITTSTPKDVKDTQQLSGEAKKTPSESATNKMEQYSSGSTGVAGQGKGGMNADK
jgi:hypothetical protein